MSLDMFSKMMEEQPEVAAGLAVGFGALTLGAMALYYCFRTKKGPKAAELTSSKAPTPLSPEERAAKYLAAHKLSSTGSHIDPNLLAMKSTTKHKAT